MNFMYYLLLFIVSEANTRARERMEDSIKSVSINGKKLNIIGSLPEPAAVALDYLHYEGRVKDTADNDRKEQTVLVVDLGHGTLDLAVVTARDNTYTENSGKEPYEVHEYGTSSHSNLGGQDFDSVLADYIKDLLRIKYKRTSFTPSQENQIVRDARRIKHQLSESGRNSAELELEFILDQEDSLPPAITRAEFEKISDGLLKRILECVEDSINL